MGYSPTNRHVLVDESGRDENESESAIRGKGRRQEARRALGCGAQDVGTWKTLKTSSSSCAGCQNEVGSILTVRTSAALMKVGARFFKIAARALREPCDACLATGRPQVGDCGVSDIAMPPPPSTRPSTG